MTPPFGFADPDLKDPQSPYFLGKYYPPGAPTLFFKQVPLKPKYYRYLFDPHFRLPLYQAVFHDSVVTTHHWLSPSLKFTGQIAERALLELPYNVPPLYHLNTKEWERDGAWIEAEYRFFSPLHRITGLLALESFTWLTVDHSVQRTVFGRQIEMVANFGLAPYHYRRFTIPGKSVLAVSHESGRSRLFTPGAPPGT
jgi:hypothetical protein